MKHVVFLFARIKQYYQAGKFIFSVFVIGSLLLNLLIIYIYGNTVTYMKSKHRNDAYYCKYGVSLNECDYEELCGELDGILQNYTIKDITFCSIVKNEGERSFLIMASRNNDVRLSWDKVKGRIYFTETEIENRDKCMIVPYESHLKPGDKKDLGRLGTFDIIGTGTFYTVNGGYISTALYEALDLPVLRIEILLEKRLTMEEHPVFMELLSTIQGAEEVIPAYGVSEDIQYFMLNMLEIFILYVFTITAFLFLLQYITVLNRRMDAVSELVGAAKGTVAFFLLAERFLISLITAAGALALHKVFYNSIFERFNLTSIDYAWRDYCIIAVIIVGSSLLASVPFVVSYARKSAIRELYE